MRKSRTNPDLWRAEGLEPLPADAPAYRLVVGAPLGRIWVSGYHDYRFQVDRIDSRWWLDRTTLPLQDEPDALDQPRRGDLIIWVGPSGSPTRPVDDVWPPSLVTGRRRTADGLSRLTTLRDGWVENVPVATAALRQPEVDWSELARGKQPLHLVGHSVLDLWQLNVWCPSCGHLGTPYALGSTQPQRYRDADGQLLPWPDGFADPSDNLPDGHTPLYRCTRCGSEWGATA
jgi:hypothetical protein